jgi:hypothetical protein
MRNQEVLNTLIIQMTDTLKAALTDNLKCGYGDAMSVRHFALTCKETGKPMEMRISLNIQAKYSD